MMSEIKSARWLVTNVSITFKFLSNISSVVVTQCRHWNWSLHSSGQLRRSPRAASHWCRALTSSSDQVEGAKINETWFGINTSILK